MYQWFFLALFFRDALVKLHKSHDKEHFHHFGKASSGFICHLFRVSDQLRWQGQRDVLTLGTVF